MENQTEYNKALCLGSGKISIMRAVYHRFLGLAGYICIFWFRTRHNSRSRGIIFSDTGGTRCGRQLTVTICRVEWTERWVSTPPIKWNPVDCAAGASPKFATTFTISLATIELPLDHIRNFFVYAKSFPVDIPNCPESTWTFAATTSHFNLGQYHAHLVRRFHYASLSSFSSCSKNQKMKQNENIGKCKGFEKPHCDDEVSSVTFFQLNSILQAVLMKDTFEDGKRIVPFSFRREWDSDGMGRCFESCGSLYTSANSFLG